MQMQNMPGMQSIQNQFHLNQNFFDDPSVMAKIQFNLFDPFDIEERQTRTSTFSVKSTSCRDEIKKGEEALYDAFVK
jgi:hypothetical protein